jgi:hypothetical protein
VVELEHTLGPGDISKAVEPEVTQRDAHREVGEASLRSLPSRRSAAGAAALQTSATIRRGPM